MSLTREDRAIWLERALPPRLATEARRADRRDAALMRRYADPLASAVRLARLEDTSTTIAGETRAPA